MNTQAMAIISTLLLIIALTNTVQTVMYYRLRRRYDRIKDLQDYYREKQHILNLEIDKFREKLWYKENKNAPNPTLDILQAGRFDPVVYEKLRPGEPDPRD